MLGQSRTICLLEWHMPPGIVQIEFLVPRSRLLVWTGNLRDGNRGFVEGAAM